MRGVERAALEELGYVILPGLVEEPLRRALLERVEALFEEEGENAGHEFRTEPHARRLANLADKGDIFWEVIAHPRVLALVEAVLGPDCKLSSLNARSTNPFAPQAQPLHVDMGQPPDARGAAVCNSIWMLDEFTRDNGAMRLVPVSHQWGRRPQEVLADPRAPHPGEILLTGAAGTVVVYNAHLWHGGTANRTNRHRRALHASYVRADLPQQQYQKRLLRAETQARLSPALRRLLALDDPVNARLCEEGGG
jgi:ectoine hydroxylase-related dioxygenase (phytanoyl-CoA dioxygenase family)